MTDPDLNITIAFRPDTFLPYIIRSYEDHDIYGKSSNDFVVYNYTEVAGVQFPRRIKLVYNEDSLLLDTLIDTVDINPNFPSDFFQGLSASQIDETAFKNRPVPAAPSAEFGEAEVFESRYAHLMASNEALLIQRQHQPALGWRFRGKT